MFYESSTFVLAADNQRWQTCNGMKVCPVEKKTHNDLVPALW
jgi:hypothetical protein